MLLRPPECRMRRGQADKPRRDKSRRLDSKLQFEFRKLQSSPQGVLMGLFIGEMERT